MELFASIGNNLVIVLEVKLNVRQYIYVDIKIISNQVA